MKRLILVLSVLFLLLPGLSFADGTVGSIASVVDANSHPMLGFNYPTYIDVRVLAADTAETHTIPSGAKYVLFAATANFYVAYSGDASVPAADVTNGAGVELNPVLRKISGLSTISLISGSACTVTLAFFK